MISADGVSVSYGPVTAVRDVDIEVREGEVLAVLGRNGAGKTTTMKALAGLLPLSGGRITHDGADVTEMAAEDRVRRGIVLVPEGRGVFADLTGPREPHHGRVPPAQAGPRPAR